MAHQVDLNGKTGTRARIRVRFALRSRCSSPSRSSSAAAASSAATSTTTTRRRRRRPRTVRPRLRRRRPRRRRPPRTPRRRPRRRRPTPRPGRSRPRTRRRQPRRRPGRGRHDVDPDTGEVVTTTTTTTPRSRRRPTRPSGRADHDRPRRLPPEPWSTPSGTVTVAPATDDGDPVPPVRSGHGHQRPVGPLDDPGPRRREHLPALLLRRQPVEHRRLPRAGRWRARRR